MRIYLTILALLFSCFTCHASSISRCTDFNVLDSLTDVVLDCEFNRIDNLLNGNLDNDNADNADGFWFVEVLSSLPAAGNQGRVVFLTADNTLYFDTGSSFVQVSTLGSAPTVVGSLIYFNGVNFSNLPPGTVDYPLVSNGSGIASAYEQLSLTTAVQGQLPLANGGTGESLVDPNADRMFFWDDSAGEVTFLQATSGVTVENTILRASAQGEALFSFVGQETAGVGFNVSTSLTTDITAPIYAYWAADDPGTGYLAIMPVFKWVKHPGVKVVTIYARIWNQAGGGGQTAGLKVTIGTASNTVTGSANQVTPEAVSMTVDVSALTNGTAYDVTIELNNAITSTDSYLSSIVAYGSES